MNEGCHQVINWKYGSMISLALLVLMQKNTCRQRSVFGTSRPLATPGVKSGTRSPATRLQLWHCVFFACKHNKKSPNFYSGLFKSWSRWMLAWVYSKECFSSLNLRARFYQILNELTRHYFAKCKCDSIMSPSGRELNDKKLFYLTSSHHLWNV